jgi:hypothetical protein
VVLLPAQLSRLAELFSDAAVGISQEGSVVSATDGNKKVVLNADGEPLTNHIQETYPKC